MDDEGHSDNDDEDDEYDDRDVDGDNGDQYSEGRNPLHFIFGQAIFIKNLTVSDLHALLIDYEKGLKDKAPTPQGFRVKRKLSYGEQYLHVGNGGQAAVEAIGVFNLVLPSGLVLSLNNCHCAPSIVRGVVSFSCLLDLGFVHTVTSNGIFVSLNGIFYFSAISVNGVFEIDMNDNVSKYNNNSNLA
ncbi:hypothetical protein Tco_0426171 [Tanacetum coccineum]